MILLILVLVLLFAICLSWLNLIRDVLKSNVRGPFPLPIIGNGHLLLVKPTKTLEVFSQLAGRYNDAFRIHILSRQYVMLSHPKYIEALVSSTELITKGRSYNFLLPWLGQGLLTSSGERWKQHRKFLTPAFHFNILQTFLPIFVKNSHILSYKLKEQAKSGKSIDNLFHTVALAALDIVTESIMGVSFHAQNDSENKYVKAIATLTEIVSLRMRNLFLALDPIFDLLPYKKAQDEAINILHSQTYKVIEARRQELEKSAITSLNGADIGIRNKHAFLDLLLLAENNGKRIDNDRVREEVDTFMFEGHDTTTAGIVYALYCISNHQDVQEKLYDELKSIFGEDMKRDPSYNELMQMKYLELVIKESLRLYPSVPLFERFITQDCNIGGLHITKNTAVLMNVFQMQRNPDVFDDPLQFRPERFEETSARSPYSWLAFSAGPRNCIGQKFAMMEMKVVLSTLIRQFKILPSNVEPQLCADLILRSANGVHIKLEERN